MPRERDPQRGAPSAALSSSGWALLWFGEERKGGGPAVGKAGCLGEQPCPRDRPYSLEALPLPHARRLVDARELHAVIMGHYVL